MHGAPAIVANPRKGPRLLQFWVKAPNTTSESAQLTAATTTDTGLTVGCELDQNTYPAGVKVSKAELKAVNLTRHTFHGEWNYTVNSKALALER
jgi:Rhodopirellula transposase DDE domain